MLYTTLYPTAIGQATLASDGEKLVGLWLEGQKYFRGSAEDDMEENNDLPVFNEVRYWLDAYFAGKQPAVSALPLAPVGSSFRRAVWDILLEIPYGKVVSYGDVARAVAPRLGKASMSGQAVGGAVGHNPISIIIPCHRVVGSDGSLTGYAGGLNKKVWLLEHEGVDMSRLFVPASGTAL